MTRKEYDLIENFEVDRLIQAEDVAEGGDRTLLYGYTCSGKTFHVYLKDGEIHTVVYEVDYSGPEKKPKEMWEVSVEYNCDYLPDKRVYGMKSDFLFCKLLKERGRAIHFVAGEEAVDPVAFYGFTLEDSLGQ